MRSLIDIFQKLWTQRTGVADISSNEELENYIKMELDDQLTHPRVRRSKREKLQFALERIDKSDLSEEEKDRIRDLYKKIAAQ